MRREEVCLRSDPCEVHAPPNRSNRGRAMVVYQAFTLQLSLRLRRRSRVKVTSCTPRRTSKWKDICVPDNLHDEEAFKVLPEG